MKFGYFSYECCHSNLKTDNSQIDGILLWEWNNEWLIDWLIGWLNDWLISNRFPKYPYVPFCCNVKTSHIKLAPWLIHALTSGKAANKHSMFWKLCGVTVFTVFGEIILPKAYLDSSLHIKLWWKKLFNRCCFLNAPATWQISLK